MRVLVATRATQGRRANDFCFADEGELVRYPIIQCAFGFVDDRCGCRRSLTGVETKKGTTTMRVVERADLLFDTYLAALRASLVRDGVNVDEERGRVLWREAKDLEALAAELTAGTVLERRGLLFRERRLDSLL